MVLVVNLEFPALVAHAADDSKNDEQLPDTVILSDDITDRR